MAGIVASFEKLIMGKSTTPISAPTLNFRELSSLPVAPDPPLLQQTYRSNYMALLEAVI